MVVFNAAIALLPGFGVYGLLISAALQDFINGALEIPLGWLSDRFGWARAVILSQGLKILVPVVDLFAVYSAWLGATEAIWLFIVLDSVIDAFVFSLQNGAYQAAYAEWYRVNLAKYGITPEEAPPLFIKSMRYAMWIRVLIPVSVIGAILAIQLSPFGSVGLSAYSATIISFAIVLILRVAVFARVYLDLSPLHTTERARIERQTNTVAMESIGEVWKSIRTNMPAFILFSLACFQTSLSSGLIAGMGMRQFNELALPEPYGWLAGLALVLTIYVLDSLFWLFWGHRIDKTNASAWIRNLGLSLLNSCMITAVLYTIEAHPLIQGAALGICVFLGTLTAGAITRFISSHVNEWLKSDLVATWMSAANCVSLFAIAAVSSALIPIDRFLPIVPALLLVSILIALSIIYYLSHGIQHAHRETVSLRTMLSRSCLSVAFLAGATVGAVTIYASVSRLVSDEQVSEQRYIAKLKQVAIVAAQDASAATPLFADAVACFTKLPEPFSLPLSKCPNGSFLAFKDYAFQLTHEGETKTATIRFDRSHLIGEALWIIGIACGLFAIAVAIFYYLLISLTRGVHREIETILNYATETRPEARRNSLDRFLVFEFKEITEKLDILNNLKSELVRHRTAADISARVAHDIRSPLTVFQMMSGSFDALPDNVRGLLHGAVQRMCEISTELLQAERQVRDSTIKVERLSASVQRVEPDDFCFVPQIVREIIGEKTACVPPSKTVTIDAAFDPSAYSTFVIASPAMLKSVIANVIQNALEAIDRSGAIEVLVKADEADVYISVRDNGRGVPESILPSLFVEKRTYGKRNGNGLGLFNARNFLEGWGGGIDIDSKVGQGTRITLRLVRAAPPNWFLPELRLPDSGNICVLDDDPTVHQLWQRRLAFIHHALPALKLKCFSLAEDFRNWLQSDELSNEDLFLIDYRLTADGESGIDIIEKLGADSNCVLVTAHAPKEIQLKCNEIRVKLIPKGMVASIPLVYERKGQFIHESRKATEPVLN